MVEQMAINWGYIVILFILGVFTYKRKSLDLIGSLVMVIMGVILIFAAGTNWLLLLILFFILCLIASHYSKDYKLKIGQYEKTRSAKNVISNGVVAFFMAAFGGYYLAFAAGFVGAIATATADTLASEIGVLYESRLITTWQEVPSGTDGAISLVGTAVAVSGAAIIGSSSWILGIISDPFIALAVGVIAGTVGCFMDSILGAVLERKEILTNEHVNLIATITGAVVGILLIGF